MTKGIYHLYRRKINSVKNKKCNPKNKWVKMFDKAILFLAILGPMFDLPQLFKIYVDKSAKDVSVYTWGLFTFFAIPWLIYGIIHKEKPIIISYSLWILIDSIIVLGIFMYH